VTHPLPDVVVAASRLRAAIEETAAALAGADLERLLACDALLQNALNDIPRSAALAGEQRLLLRRQAEDAQAALRRCRHLGSALTDFVRFTLDAQGLGSGYEPGRSAARALTGRGFNEKA
jgi:hypothetical protein